MPRGLSQTGNLRYVAHRRHNWDFVSVLARHTRPQVSEHGPVAAPCHRTCGGMWRRVCDGWAPSNRSRLRGDGRSAVRGRLGCLEVSQRCTNLRRCCVRVTSEILLAGSNNPDGLCHCRRVLLCPLRQAPFNWDKLTPVPTCPVSAFTRTFPSLFPFGVSIIPFGV
jgi:hypothetical protein